MEADIKIPPARTFHFLAHSMITQCSGPHLPLMAIITEKNDKCYILIDIEIYWTCNPSLNTHLGGQIKTKSLCFQLSRAKA